MHSGSKFWSTLPIAKKKIKMDGVLSKDKVLDLERNNVKIDEDTIIDIQSGSLGITRNDIFFVLDNSVMGNGNSFILDPGIYHHNIITRLVDKRNNILGFGLSVLCSLYISGEKEYEVESGLTTHLCVSRKHRNKELAKYVISGIIDYGYTLNIHTGYHYIKNPKTAVNTLVFNYYRPLNLENAIQFGYEVPMLSKDVKFSWDNLPSESQKELLELEYQVRDSDLYEILPSEFDDLRFLQGQGRKLSVSFSAIRFEQLKKQFEFCSVKRDGKVVGLVMFKTMIIHIGKIDKGCPIAQICLLELDKDYRKDVAYKIISYLKEKKYVVMSGVCFGELSEESFRKSLGLVLCDIQYLDFYNFNIELKGDSSDVNVLYY